MFIISYILPCMLYSSVSYFVLEQNTIPPSLSTKDGLCKGLPTVNSKERVISMTQQKIGKDLKRHS